MIKQVIKEAFGWGLLLWLIGYILGILFFSFMPVWLIGWIIMPIGTAIALWLLVKKIKGTSFGYYFLLAVIWTSIAVICDYFFLVKLFKPVDGYYKLDVFIYYILTFAVPIAIGLIKKKRYITIL